MADYTQISAQISESAKQRLDAYARETGLKKGRIIEDAIVSHLDALEQLPADYIVPSRLIVSADTWSWVAQEIDAPSEPTADLRKLMSGAAVSED